MFGKLSSNNCIYADENEIEYKHKCGPAEHRHNPSLDVVQREEGSLTEKKAAQDILVFHGKPFGDMPPEQISPVIFLCVKPERVGNCTDQLVHAGVSGHGRHHNDHDVDD